MGAVALELVAFIHWASWRWNRQLSSIGRVGIGTGRFHPLGELALELAAFIHWASWRWNWTLSSIGRVGARCLCLLFLKPGEGKSDGKDTVSGKAWVKGKTHAHARMLLLAFP